MGFQVPVHPPGRPHGHTHRWRRLSRTRRLILFFVLFLFVVSVALVIFNALAIIQGAWFGNVSIIFSALSAIAAILAWLFPVDPSITSGSFIGNVGQCPSIDSDLTVWLERSLPEVYENLIDSNISALVLKGLSGTGTSTLASLICDYAEKQRLYNLGPFFDKSLWFYIDANTTIPDLAEELSMNLRKALPDLSHLAPQHQAEQLFLNISRMRRLIVLDFKNPLDNQTRDALADRPGFKEFLRLLNSRFCDCRVLLTSRPWSSDTSGYKPEYIQEYCYNGLDDAEGIELLRKYNVDGVDDELRSAVRLCNGHPGALIALTSILSEYPMSLTSFLEDHAYVQIWMQEISNRFFDHIYLRLDSVQKELLFACSIYRKPIPIEAMQVVMVSNLSREQLLLALPKLTRHNLFLDLGERDYYQLHAVVANYARDHFGDTSDSTKLQEAHRKAALYYQDIIDNLPSLGPPGRRIELLIERAWHLHKAGEDQRACNLIEQEQLLKHIL